MLELLKGDTSSFPEQSDLTYRYTPLDSCKKAQRGDRRGELRVTFHGIMDEAGSKIVLESSGFQIGGSEMEGRSVIEREQGYWLFRWKGTAFLVEGDRVTMTGEMKVVRTLGGMSKGHVSDDRYRFEPRFKGEGIGDASYQVDHGSSLERDMGCRWPWKGVLRIKPRDLGVRKLDYGDGRRCSDSGEVLVNGMAASMNF